jgi:putative transposase
MFGDEASFGRISDPTGCWAPPKERPTVPCQRIRQYKTVYGAVSPVDGDGLFYVLDKSDTENTNVFLRELSNCFSDDIILLCLDRASWHRSKDLIIPANIKLFFIPPRTPEMNPIEIIWREIRKIGFKNKCFNSLSEVVDTFLDVINNRLPCSAIKNITLWDWIADIIT